MASCSGTCQGKAYAYFMTGPDTNCLCCSGDNFTLIGKPYYNVYQNNQIAIAFRLVYADQDCTPSTTWWGQLGTTACMTTCQSQGLAYFVNAPDNNCKCCSKSSSLTAKGNNNIFRNNAFYIGYSLKSANYDCQPSSQSWGALGLDSCYATCMNAGYAYFLNSPSNCKCCNTGYAVTSASNSNVYQITAVVYACAPGYVLNPGHSPSSGLVNGRGNEQVTTCSACATLCDAQGGSCWSYECSTTLLTCRLNGDQNPTQGGYLDYSFCSKAYSAQPPNQDCQPGHPWLGYIGMGSCFATCQGQGYSAFLLSPDSNCKCCSTGYTTVANTNYFIYQTLVFPPFTSTTSTTTTTATITTSTATTVTTTTILGVYGNRQTNQDCQPGLPWLGVIGTNGCLLKCREGYGYFLIAPDNNCKCCADGFTPVSKTNYNIYTIISPPRLTTTTITTTTTTSTTTMTSTILGVYGTQISNQDCQPNLPWLGIIGMNGCLLQCQNQGYAYFLNAPDNNCKCCSNGFTTVSKGSYNIYPIISPAPLTTTTSTTTTITVTQTTTTVTTSTSTTSSTFTTTTSTTSTTSTILGVYSLTASNQDCQPGLPWLGIVGMNACLLKCRDQGYGYFLNAPDNNCKCCPDGFTTVSKGNYNIYQLVSPARGR